MYWHEVFCIFILLSSLGGGAAWCQTAHQIPYRTGMPLQEYVKNLCSESGDSGRYQKTVAIFIEFLRFGCLSCLNAFLDFCDSLKALNRQCDSCEVVLIFKKDNQEDFLQYRQMKSWVQASGLNFRFAIAPEELFAVNYISDVAVLILDRDYEYDFYTQFPLTQGKKGEIMRILCEETGDIRQR